MIFVLQQKLHKFLAQSSFKALSRSAFVALGLTLFFSSCSKHQSIAEHATTTLHLGSAKHFDIPQPVGFTASTKQAGLAGDYLLYTGLLSRPKVIDFYLHTMESNGWEIQNFSNQFEGLLICTKPNKACSISIRSEKNTTVHVFVKQLVMAP